jgi:hypothetical protein
MKRVIFLDIDGVLATPKQYATRRTKLYKRDSTAAGLGIPYLFDEKCVIAFNRFILMNDVEIVLSSDWRRHFDLSEINTIFKINGVAKSPFSFTEIFNKADAFENLASIRVREIKDWLNNNEYILWCAVDDMDLSELGHQFVQTDERMGFGDRDFFRKVEAAMYPF